MWAMSRLRVLLWCGLFMSLWPTAAAAAPNGWSIQAPTLPPSIMAGQSLTMRIKPNGYDARGLAADRPSGAAVLVDGVAVAATAIDGGFEAKIEMPSDKPTVQLAWRIITAAGQRDGPPATLRIIPLVKTPTEKQVRWEVTLRAGCALDLACQPLTGIVPDGSPPEAMLAVRRTGPAGLEHAQVVLMKGDKAIGALPWKKDPTLVAPSSDLRICLMVPACEVPSDGVWLEDLQVDVVASQTSPVVVSKQPTRLGLRAPVKSVGWLRCHAEWFGIAAALAVILCIFLGFHLPKSFSRTMTVKLASSERNLVRADYRPLYGLPGGRSGFYRSARVRFDASGAATRSTGWALQLSPGDSGTVQFASRSNLEVKRSGRWTAVTKGEALSSGADYRFGDVYFRLS